MLFAIWQCIVRNPCTLQKFFPDSSFESRLCPCFIVTRARVCHSWKKSVQKSDGRQVTRTLWHSRNTSFWRTSERVNFIRSSYARSSEWNDDADKRTEEEEIELRKRERVKAQRRKYTAELSLTYLTGRGFHVTSGW